MEQEKVIISGQMQTYFDGLYYCDTARLREVFHPHGRYVCATDSELVNLGTDEYFPIVDKRKSPASRGEPRQDQIVSIAFAGPKTAFVKAHCAIGSKLFTDFLTFIKTENRWQIIAKVFHYDLIT